MGQDKSKPVKDDIPGLPEKTKISVKEKEWVEKTVLNNSKKKKKTIRRKRNVDYGDEESVLGEMETNTGNLAFATEELRKDRKFMLKAIKKDPFTFMYSDDDLKKDKEFVIAVLRNSFTQIVNEEREYVFRFLDLIDLRLKIDTEVTLEMINRFPFILKRGKFDYIPQNQFYLGALARNPVCIRYMNKVFEYSKEYQRLSAIHFLRHLENSQEYAYNSFRFAGVCVGEEGNQLMWYLHKLVMIQSDSDDEIPREQELKYQVQFANGLFDLHEKYETYEFNRVPNPEWDVEEVKGSMVHVINSCIRNIDFLLGKKGLFLLQEVCDSSEIAKFAELVVKVFKDRIEEDKKKNNIRHRMFSWCCTVLVQQLSGIYLSFLPDMNKMLEKYESELFGFGDQQENTESLFHRTKCWFERNMEKLKFIKLWKERRKLMEIKLGGGVGGASLDNSNSEEQLLEFVEESREVFLEYYNELKSLYVDVELHAILEKYDCLLGQYERDVKGIISRHKIRNEGHILVVRDVCLERIPNHAHKVIKLPLEKTMGVLIGILEEENKQVNCIFDFWRGIYRMDEDIQDLGIRMNELASGLDLFIQKYDEAVTSFTEWKGKVKTFSLRKRIRELDECVDSETSLSPEDLENNISVIESKHKEIKEDMKTLDELEKDFFPFFTDENHEVSKSLQIHRTELDDQYSSLKKDDPSGEFGEASVDHKNSLQKSFDEFSKLLSIELEAQRKRTMEVVKRQIIRTRRMEQRFSRLFYWFNSRSGFLKYKKQLSEEYKFCVEERMKNSVKVMKMFWKGCEFNSRKLEIRNEMLELGQKLFKVKMEISRIEHHTNKKSGMFGIVPVKKTEEKEEEEENEGEDEDDDDDDPNKKLVDLYAQERDLDEKSKKIEEEEGLMDWKVERIKLMVRLLEKKTFTFLRSELERKQKEEHPNGLSNEEQFEDFLKSHNLFVKRDISSKHYEGVKRLHADQEEQEGLVSTFGDLYFGKLKTDWAKEPKILKIISSNARTRIQTENEISTLQTLPDHPSIAKINHVFMFKNKIAMEMEYYRTDLLRWLRGYTFQKELCIYTSSKTSTTSSRINEQQFIHRLRIKKSVRKKNKIVEVFRRVLEGISYLHKMGIQHGDLRPTNILINDEDNHLEVKIISFGKSRNSKKTSSVLKTRHYSNGSPPPRYLSPEEIEYLKNGEDKDEENGFLKKETISQEDYEARDIWSFGMILLEVMTIKPPKEFEKEVQDGDIRNLLSNEGGLYDRDSGMFNNSLWIKLGIKDEKVKEVLQYTLVPDPSRRYSSTDILQKCGLFNSVMVDDFDLEKLIRKDNILNIKEKLKTLRESTLANRNNNNNNRRSYSYSSSWISDHDYSSTIYVNVDRRSPHIVNASSSSSNNNNRRNRGRRRRNNNRRRIDEEEEEELGKNMKRKDVVLRILKQVLGREVVKELKDLVRRISCSFEGESAVDAGGVSREMFSTLFLQVVSFGYCDQMGRNKTNNSVYYLPTDNKDHSEVFYLLGILCFRCLLQNNCFRVSFPPFFYSFLLGQMPETREDWFQHCKFCAPDCIPLIEKTLFSSTQFEYIKGDTFEDDNNNEFELKESNKMDYLLYKVKTKLRGVKGMGFRMKNMESFKRGFNAFIPQNTKLEIQNILNPFELDRIVYGQRYLSEKVFFDNIKYENGFGSTIEQYMKIIFKGKDDRKRWEFIQFCTGSSDIVDGKLVKGAIVQKIEVKRSIHKDYFKAATCFYVLHVGFNFENENFEVFNRMINMSLEYLRLGDMQE